MEDRNKQEQASEWDNEQDLQRDIAWIREMLHLEENEIPLPDSLRSESLFKQLEAKEASDRAAAVPPVSKSPASAPPPRPKKLWWKLAGCAACFAFLALCWQGYLKSRPPAELSAPAAAQEESSVAIRMTPPAAAQGAKAESAQESVPDLLPASSKSRLSCPISPSPPAMTTSFRPFAPLPSATKTLRGAPARTS